MKFLLLCGLMAFASAAPSPLTHDAAVALLKQSQHDIAQPLVPQVPGLAEHQAALDSVLALQGLNPGLNVHSAAEARHLQAEAALLAVQQQQAAAIAA